jgi:hypothetical protein
MPSGITTYFEVPVHAYTSEALEAISAFGSRVKLRMGGMAAEAIPSSKAVAKILEALADSQIPFKATAGLHHPIRSCHPFSDEPGSPVGTMNGFLNLFLAATLIHFGGDVSEAIRLLEERDPGTWRVTPEGLGWHSYCWSQDQLRTVREEFAISFGSCSFEEPIHDLEALGWL